MAKIAIIETGAKQYLVKEGDVVMIEKVTGLEEPGAKIIFDKVLMTDDGKATKVGAPYVSGAKVTGELVANGREAKVTVLRYRQKSRWMSKRGHRQPFAKVKILSL